MLHVHFCCPALYVRFSCRRVALPLGDPVRTIFDLCFLVLAVMPLSSCSMLPFLEPIEAARMQFLGGGFCSGIRSFSGHALLAWSSWVSASLHFGGGVSVYSHPFLAGEWPSECFTFMFLRWRSCVEFLRQFVFSVSYRNVCPYMVFLKFCFMQLWVFLVFCCYFK